MSDPFQLHVKVRSGHQRNIMDVGYGVSQSLPIIVDVLAAEEQIGERNGNYCTFLMQQPEVHLHPRAQAELASFFADSYSKRNNRFMIETHSECNHRTAFVFWYEPVFWRLKMFLFCTSNHRRQTA